MNLYISLKWLEEHIEVVSYEGMWHETETDEFVSVKNIHSAPSIDIVRCAECRHWEMRNSPRGWCVVHQGYVSPQYFCADGERMKGADDE